MVRRRTAVSLAAAALLAVTPVIAACGTPHAGSAAVVGGEQISVSALQSQVNEVRTAQQRAPQGAQLLEGSPQLTRATLNSMVFARVLDRAASDAGITVTRGDVQQTRASLERQTQGADNLKAQMLKTYGVAPSGIDGFCRSQIQLDKLSRGVGADLNTAAGKSAVSRLLVTASNELGIEISPRYGTWNVQQLQLAPGTEPWIAKTAEVQAEPQA